MGPPKRKPAPQPNTSTQVWRAGVDDMEQDEELSFDPTVYTCFKDFMLEWPCLSFSIIKDGLGGPRTAYPQTLYLAAGTQAETPQQNFIALVKISNLQANKSNQDKEKEKDKDKDKENDEDDYEANDMLSEDEDSDEGEEEEEEETAQFSFKKIKHNGGVNRIRSMPQQPAVIATWSELGSVQIWDASEQLRQLSMDSFTGGSKKPEQVKCKQSHSRGVEGYAIDWSPLKPGRLASGDNRSGIFVWEATSGGSWNISGAYKGGHEGSIEDIQWSHSEEAVFVSCSSDQTIRVWDVRERNKSMLTVKAHDSDVNVISWNPLLHYMLLSGDDNGQIKVWDLRSFSDEASSVANFSYHQAPVTSLEWCPQESSSYISTGSDNQLIVWDLAVERDPEEEIELGPKDNAELTQQIPPQILFIHGGQNDMKEGHWHPQIPGMILSTAQSGFHILHPYNVNPLEEQHKI